MFNKIRNELMHDQDGEQLSGDVEVDETGWGGKPRNKGMNKQEAAVWREANKRTILGMVERDGRVRLRVIPSRRGPALSREVRSHVNPSAFLLTDDWQAYKPLGAEYLDHRVINHSAGVYVLGDMHTNTIEGFFGNLKTGMRGTYKHVSDKWIQSYLDEYAYRYNERLRGPRAMFHNLLEKAAK